VLFRIHNNAFRLLSIEQQPGEITKYSNIINQLDCSSCCRIVYAPLIATNVGGRTTKTYDLASVSSEHFRWLGKSDFVLIDGPYAEGPCRYGTLAQCRSFLQSGAVFVLDDALREKELFAALNWVKEGIFVEGIYTLGAGIMIGHVP